MVWWDPAVPNPPTGLGHKKAVSPRAFNSSKQRSCSGCITWAAAGEAIEELAVHVVTLAVGAIDVFARRVTGVAGTAPAHAVPLARAHQRAVVPPAAVFQLLAALPFGVALAVLPCVS